MENETILEFVEFSLKPDSNKTDFLNSSYEMMIELRNQPGFIKRELLNQGKKWIDIIHWNSLNDVKRAAIKVLSLPRCNKFFDFIDEKSIKSEHFQKIKHVPK